MLHGGLNKSDRNELLESSGTADLNLASARRLEADIALRSASASKSESYQVSLTDDDFRAAAGINTMEHIPQPGTGTASLGSQTTFHLKKKKTAH